MESGIVFTTLDKEAIYKFLFHEAHEHSYTAYIRGKRCKTEHDFFREASAALQFPWYFGENWAAFDECICDLEWLAFEQLFIVVDDFSLIFEGDIVLQSLLKKYLAITLHYWRNEGIPISIWLNN